MGIRNYVDRVSDLKTPFYFYDMDLLRATLRAVTDEAGKYGFRVHYAMKANFSDRIVREMKNYGIGIDSVSGGEVKKAIDCGIPASEIVFAGVAKSDEEIIVGLEYGIFSFNCESREELQVIDRLAAERGKTARVALRLNPDVDPHTHKYISTGKADNKFGISYEEVDEVIEQLQHLKNIEIVGLHFHIGSQIGDWGAYDNLCSRINEIQDFFETKGLRLDHINAGGGLAIDYTDPAREPIPDFARYFKIFADKLMLRPGQTLHFELGRSLVAQCGELVTRVLYNKTTLSGLKIALVDAGMTELIRPALYQSVHRIENLTSAGPENTYMVSGPICESSDTFAKGIVLPETKRGDLLTIMSAGAYGRSMSSNYNLREFPQEIFSDDL